MMPLFVCDFYCVVTFLATLFVGILCSLHGVCIPSGSIWFCQVIVAPLNKNISPGLFIGPLREA